MKKKPVLDPQTLTEARASLAAAFAALDATQLVHKRGVLRDMHVLIRDFEAILRQPGADVIAKLIPVAYKSAIALARLLLHELDEDDDPVVVGMCREAIDSALDALGPHVKPADRRLRTLLVEGVSLDGILGEIA